VNNHIPDLDRLPETPITRFVRDPRDLVVSGYHYHRRGAEIWCRLDNPTERDWSVVNGTVPDGLADGESFASYLQRVDLETGLIAEMDFRKRHFEAMRDFPADPRVLTIRYEEIVGNERRAFASILRHYEMALPERVAGGWFASRYRASRRATDGHIRNSDAGQWQEFFTPSVAAEFRQRYGDLPERLGYDS
jgi:hypothetical protein